MSWMIIATPEFAAWYGGLDEADAERVSAAVDYLEQEGPRARRPMVGAITTSRHANVKELRPGSLRILSCFDPGQQAILLLGADKSRAGWNACYRTAIDEVDLLMDRWLADPTSG